MAQILLDTKPLVLLEVDQTLRKNVDKNVDWGLILYQIIIEFLIYTINLVSWKTWFCNNNFVPEKKMSLIATFESISKNFKLKPQEYIIDNWVFRLHYKASVLIFLVSTILVCSRQYIGEHIRCIADGGVPEHVMNTFCFFTSTFTVVSMEFWR